jgi:P27 family predicted phage terminase small subunit
MGRPKKPPQLKVLEGTFRGDRDAHGVKVDTGIPNCPADAPDCVKKVWSDIAPMLASQGLLSVADGMTFYAYLDSYTKFVMVSHAIKAIEDMLEQTPNGYLQMSQAFHVRNKLWNEVMKAGREFGHTPASRSAIKAPKQGQLDLGGFEDF